MATWLPELYTKTYNLNTRRKGYLMRLFLGILLLTVSLSSAEEIYAVKKFNNIINVDSITGLKHPEQLTIVEKGQDRGAAFYYALTVKDLPYSSDKIQSVILNVKKYSKQFGHVKQSRAIDEESSCYFLELRSRMARSWLVGNVKQEEEAAGVKEIAFIQNHDKQLNEKWKKEKRGLINVGYKQFQIVWIIKKISDAESQLALVAYVKPGAGIPDWLYQAAAKNILPSLVSDVEKNLAVQK
jgi:hypothetical protein